MKITANTKRLNEYIDKSGYRKDYIAEKMGIVPPRLSEKLNGRVALYPLELIKILQIIGLGDAELKNQTLIDWYPADGES